MIHAGCALFCEVLVVENVVRTEAVIALTLGAVPELQFRVVGVRAAADFALVAVAPLRLCLLLLPDGGLELNGLDRWRLWMPKMLLISSQKKITKFKIATTAARALA